MCVLAQCVVYLCDVSSVNGGTPSTVGGLGGCFLHAARKVAFN